MKTIFEAISEDTPGVKWQNAFNRTWPAYQKWFKKNGLINRATYLICRKNLIKYMPELVPVYERLCELAGGSDIAARFLSLYCPPAYISGCSQLIWDKKPTRLIRNYDYSPNLLDGIILNSKWLDQRVIAVSDCLIGVLDGMNENGLCVSLTFGGSKTIGQGFGIPIILRYILETCETANQAEQALKRIPTHMAYNVSVLDAHTNYFTAHLFPEKEPIINYKLLSATNQQPFDDKWQTYARATATRERQTHLQLLINTPQISFNQVATSFAQPPLYSTNYKQGFGTLYTTIYCPNEKLVELHWPDSSWLMGFNHSIEAQRIIQYTESGTTTLLQTN